MTTPDIPQLLLNLNNFVSKWSNAERNGHKIITEKVSKQISALRSHIERGCLSGIEPGGGTNYNEALHRHINPHFSHAGRIGLPLAYALLTVILFVHNCKKEACELSLTKICTANMCKANEETKLLAPFGVIGQKMSIGKCSVLPESPTRLVPTTLASLQPARARVVYQCSITKYTI